MSKLFLNRRLSLFTTHIDDIISELPTNVIFCMWPLKKPILVLRAYATHTVGNLYSPDTSQITLCHYIWVWRLVHHLLCWLRCSRLVYGRVDCFLPRKFGNLWSIPSCPVHIEDCAVNFRVDRWGEAVTALMTSCIDIVSINGEDSKTMDSVSPGGVTKKTGCSSNSFSPVRNSASCVLPPKKKNALSDGCRGYRCPSSKARRWNVGFCCVL